MRIERPAKVVRHPLTHTGRNAFFRIRTNGIQKGNEANRNAGEEQNLLRFGAHGSTDEREQPSMGIPVRNDVVKHDLKRPRFEKVRNALTCDGQKSEPEQFVVGPQQL
jgi:hypothetical protein